MDPITAIANAVGSIFGFAGQISANRNPQRDLVNNLYEDPDYYSRYKPDMTPVYLVLGGFVVITALIIMSSMKSKSKKAA